jgi:hypothetical protein
VAHGRLGVVDYVSFLIHDAIDTLEECVLLLFHISSNPIIGLNSDSHRQTRKPTRPARLQGVDGGTGGWCLASRNPPLKLSFVSRSDNRLSVLMKLGRHPGLH